jgi:hypothetical protein
MRKFLSQVVALAANFVTRQPWHLSIAHFVTAACAENPPEDYLASVFFLTGQTFGLCKAREKVRTDIDAILNSWRR